MNDLNNLVTKVFNNFKECFIYYIGIMDTKENEIYSPIDYEHILASKLICLVEYILIEDDIKHNPNFQKIAPNTYNLPLHTFQPYTSTSTSTSTSIINPSFATFPNTTTQGTTITVPEPDIDNDLSKYTVLLTTINDLDNIVINDLDLLNTNRPIYDPYGISQDLKDYVNQSNLNSVILEYKQKSFMFSKKLNTSFDLFLYLYNLARVYWIYKNKSLPPAKSSLLVECLKNTYLYEPYIQSYTEYLTGNSYGDIKKIDNYLILKMFAEHEHYIEFDAIESSKQRHKLKTNIFNKIGF